MQGNPCSLTIIIVWDHPPIIFIVKLPQTMCNLRPARLEWLLGFFRLYCLSEGENIKYCIVKLALAKKITTLYRYVVCPNIRDLYRIDKNQFNSLVTLFCQVYHLFPHISTHFIALKNSDFVSHMSNDV